MTLLTPQPVLRHLLDRLRLNYVPVGQYSDDDVLVMLNDAYREVCERTGVLQALTTITLITDQQEYALPADFERVELVVAGGQELSPISLSDALLANSTMTTPQGGYYTYGGMIGFNPVPGDVSTSLSVILAYAATPTPFASYDSVPDARYPIEYLDILVHHVSWRVLTLSGGAESLGVAAVNRQVYDTRTNELRRSYTRVESVRPTQFQHVSDRRRLRTV